MSNYSKLWSSLVTSSIWNEDDKTRIVWITMLALKEADGVVRASVGGLAHMARVTIDDCRNALHILESPDSDSRTTDDEGRRIRVVDGGFLVINHDKYREGRNDEARKDYMRDYMNGYRSDKKKPTKERKLQPSAELVKVVDATKQLQLPHNDESFLRAWGEWNAHRKQIKKPMTPLAEQKLLDKLASLSSERAVKAINYSISQGWQGIFEEKMDSNKYVVTTRKASTCESPQRAISDEESRIETLDGIMRDSVRSPLTNAMKTLFAATLKQVDRSKLSMKLQEFCRELNL